MSEVQETRLARTNENYLRWKFGRAVIRSYTTNVTLIAPGEPTSAQLEPDESAIAFIELQADTVPVLVTDARLMRGAETMVRFAEVESCNWIDNDITVAAARKTTSYQRLILDVGGGREVVVDGLGQAAFPLLSFFWNKLGRRRRRAKE